MDAMKKLSEVCQDPVPKGLAELEELPIRHKEIIEVAEMKENVASYIKELFND